MQKKIILISFLFLIILKLNAQRIVADKIIGIVGDKFILKSTIDNQIDEGKRNGATFPPNIECLLLDRELSNKALVIQAAKDSLPISDEEVESILDNRIRYFIQLYGGKEALEQISGRTIFQLKEDFRDAIREGEMAKAMQNKILENVKITPTEVKAFFEKIPKDSLPYFEAMYEICQIVAYPKPSRELEKYSMDELNGFKSQIETGQRRFEVLARLYSDDPGTKENGGLFEFNKNDRGVDKNFVIAASRLKENQVSPVIKSQFGYHIIQLISRSGDDMVVRHILKIPLISKEDIAEAKAKLDSVRAKLIAGTIDFGKAVEQYSDDPNKKFAYCFMGKDRSTLLTIDELDKSVVLVLDKLKVGEYSEPMEYKDERDKLALRILYLKTKTEPHRMNMKDDYNRISEAALGQKKERVLEDWLAEHTSNYYVSIEPEYLNCEILKKWVAKKK